MTFEHHRVTLNVENCTCGEDHDSLHHIIEATIIAFRLGVFDEKDDPVAAAAREAEKLAHLVGWTQK